jgi:4-amino-4-deoxy-L-arabinose transferase-like glycosyltransferase
VSRAQSAWAAGAAALLAIAVAGLYGSGLGESPPYLMHDELQFSLQARSMAETGHDLAGRRFPVFFTEPEFPPGRDPMIIYVTAAALKFLPFSESAARLPTALLGAVNVALIFVVGWRLFGNAWLGLLAAVLLAFTPIHFIRARLALSPFYSIPFILGWLIALSAYLRTGSRRSLIAAASCLAISAYTYLACAVMAPVYFAITAFVAVRRQGWKALAPPIATALLILAPMVIWYATHPERYGQLIEAYRLYGSGTPGAAPMPELAPGTPAGPQRWIGLLWQFINPDFLFLSGDSSLINSTRSAGLFPIAFAALIVAGVWSAARSSDTLTRVVLAGLVTAPLASVLSGAVEMNRIMFVIPFGVLMAAIGAAALLKGSTAQRVLAVTLLLTVPIQFAAFHRYYVRDYPAQAGPWFGGNLRDAVLTTIAGSGPAYVSSRIPMAERYWKFYLPRDQRERPLERFVDPPGNAAVGSRAVCAAADPACAALGRSAQWQQAAAIRELSGEVSFLVFERR